METLASASQEAIVQKAGMGIRRRKHLVRNIAFVVMLIYSFATLAPFYVLFIRTFVGTQDIGQLHLWIPEAQPLSRAATVGNLANFYSLDIGKMKADFGIPDKEYISPRLTLEQFAQQYNIPFEKLDAYFNGYYTWNGWMTVLEGGEFLGVLARSVIVNALSIVGVVFFGILTGYGLAGLRYRGQRVIYYLYQLQLVIPLMLVILPQILLVQWVQNLIPNYQAGGLMRTIVQLLTLVVINIRGGAISTMIFANFIGDIPPEIEDAAFIDGAGHWQYLRYVLIPLLKVPIISLVVIQLPALWNELLPSLLYLDRGNTTLLPYILDFASNFDLKFQVIYTSIFVSVIPLAVLYIVFRRFFVEGVMAGAIKG